MTRCRFARSRRGGGVRAQWPPLIWLSGYLPRCAAGLRQGRHRGLPVRGAAAGWAVRSSGERHGAPGRGRCDSAWLAALQRTSLESGAPSPACGAIRRWPTWAAAAHCTIYEAIGASPGDFAPYMKQTRPLVKPSPDFARYMAHFPAPTRQMWRIRPSQLAPGGDNDSPDMASRRAIHSPPSAYLATDSRQIATLVRHMARVQGCGTTLPDNGNEGISPPPAAPDRPDPANDRPPL